MKCCTAAMSIIVFVEAGCAATPGQGSNPNDPGAFPDNYKVLVKTLLNQTLRDLYSVRNLTITRPVAHKI